jgi:hypothetical protein
VERREAAGFGRTNELVCLDGLFKSVLETIFNHRVDPRVHPSDAFDVSLDDISGGDATFTDIECQPNGGSFQEVGAHLASVTRSP